MKFKELKALPHGELREKMLELKKELMKENAQVAIGTVPKNPRKLRLAKKTIARIETILARASTSERGPADKLSAVGAASQKTGASNVAAKLTEAPKK